MDFVFFWQTIRSIYQKTQGLFTFLIVGTNPMCVEKSSILGKDNPVFNAIPFQYIERFDVPHTREMVRKLGRYMGLKFEENIYTKLTEDYGGQPYLIRHCCSVLNQLQNKADRPIVVNRKKYEKAKENFDEKYYQSIELILEVLKKHFTDEYELLELLAVEDYDTFNDFATNFPELTNHLQGYGIIEKYDNGYDFKIDAVKKYLAKTSKRNKKLLIKGDEMREEIRKRVHGIETKLRKIVRTQLKARFGESIARQKTLDIFGGKRKTNYDAFSYNDLFDANKTDIHFEDLKKIILKEWTIFEHLFSRRRKEFESIMEKINEYRRVPAHSKDITDRQMSNFILNVEWIEEHVNDIA